MLGRILLGRGEPGRRFNCRCRELSAAFAAKFLLRQVHMTARHARHGKPGPTLTAKFLARGVVGLAALAAYHAKSFTPRERGKNLALCREITLILLPQAEEVVQQVRIWAIVHSIGPPIFTSTFPIPADAPTHMPKQPAAGVQIIMLFAIKSLTRLSRREIS